VYAGGARCTGRGDTWSVACGDPIASGFGGRVAVKVTNAGYAAIGVLSSTASRNEQPGLQQGGIGLHADGRLVNGQFVQGTVKGFGKGLLLGVAVLGVAGGERIIVFYINGEEVGWQALPAGEYRFAVGGCHNYDAFEMVDAAVAAAFWAEAARLEQLQSDIAAGRIAGFDANDKGRNAIVKVGGARCTGYTGGAGGWRWSVACGEPIGSGGEGRAAVKVTKAADLWASIGVISSAASREKRPGDGQEGSIALNRDGALFVDGKLVRSTYKRFDKGDLLGVAVLRAGGERVVAFYINGQEVLAGTSVNAVRQEVCRQALPAGEYRFAVGGDGGGAAFEVVDAAAAASREKRPGHQGGAIGLDTDDGLWVPRRPVIQP
jgi:hypothetical protein